RKHHQVDIRGLFDAIPASYGKDRSSELAIIVREPGDGRLMADSADLWLTPRKYRPPFQRHESGFN
ncbi:MAG: hypothetical protein ACXW3N_01435, partial [Rhodoplanes sp.]